MFDRFVQGSFRVALASIAALLVTSSSASARPTWLTPTSLSATGQNATTAQVAVDGEGDSVAVWQIGPDSMMNNEVEASVRPAGGTWQTTPTNLASCFFFATTPQIAVDPSGDAVAVWECAAQSSGGRVIDAATASGPALRWSQPVQLSDSADINVEDPRVAIDAKGDATVTWVTLGSAATSFVQAAQRPAGGAWSKPVAISRTDKSVSAAPVAEDRSGDATAVWTVSNGTNLVTEASMHPAGAAAWSAPSDLSSADAAASNPQVAISSQGTSIAVWQHGSNTSSTIQAAIHPAGGQWQPPADISASGQLAEHPQVAVDPQGNAAAVWDRSNAGNTIVQAARLPAGAAAWQSAANLSGPGQNATAAQIAADAQGDLTAVWQRSDGANTIVQAAVDLAGGAWQAATNLSAAGENAENPAVAVDPRGNATAVWDRSNGTDTIAQAAGLDAGPLIFATIPATGTVNRPVTFTAGPVGVWSPIVSDPQWAFGDGTMSAARSVAHSYASPGPYTVTVSAADGVGNVTTQAGEITIGGSLTNTPPASAPTLTRISQSHKKWREGSKPATIARKRKPKRPPVGTRFSFAVNEPARVTFAFAQTTAGREVKGKCQAPTMHNRKRPRCERTITRGTLTYTTTSGRHTVAFDGRVAGRKLPDGAYTVRITATNSSRQRSRTASLRFTIAK